MASETIYRSSDGLDWHKFEDAQKWEERVNAVKRSLDEMGGYDGLCQVTQQTENREGGFLRREVGFITAERLAESLEEIAALGKWAQKVLDEVGIAASIHQWSPARSRAGTRRRALLPQTLGQM